MIKWGMVGNSLDASLAVFDNDDLLWASSSKDFSGVPNDPILTGHKLKWQDKVLDHPKSYLV